ncbi:MAG: tyrosine-type recombinase/integrase [Planctomycetaceae bacterium]|nr:tyrosine-type recombinase/integrase [Planctomycetaceae bacterium]
MKLQHMVDRYVSYRQAMGDGFASAAKDLRCFARFIGPTADLTAVRPKQVKLFLDGRRPGTRSWHVRYGDLSRFYRYVVSHGYLAKAPLPRVTPRRPPPFVPYIYSREELGRLLRGTDTYQQRPNCLEPITLRTLILLLYGAGLRLGEAVALNRGDVDLTAAVITIRRTKFYKSRLVPFGTHLGQALVRYAATRPGPVAQSPCHDVPFFTTRTDTRVKKYIIHRDFQRLREHAGVRRSDSERSQPRLHDLRHSFAVHRLTSWYRQGADVQKLLPYLSTYLGHASLRGTQVYLSMTPELLHEAAARFNHYVWKEERDEG